MKEIISIITLSLALQGCIGSAVGATTDAAIALARVPFKVAGAAVGAVAQTAGAIVGDAAGDED